MQHVAFVAIAKATEEINSTCFESRSSLLIAFVRAHRAARDEKLVRGTLVEAKGVVKLNNFHFRGLTN